MFIKNKLILIFFIIFGLVCWGGFDYWNFNKVAKAVGSMPWQDGGIINKVVPKCILDTPAILPTTCAISCPGVTSIYGTGCVGYVEIMTQSQYGTAFLAVPTGFKYGGGGTQPMPGMQYVAGGASNVTPWVIGIPGGVAYKVQQTKNWFNKFIIAGFKSEE